MLISARISDKWSFARRGSSEAAKLNLLCMVLRRPLLQSTGLSKFAQVAVSHLLHMPALEQSTQQTPTQLL